MDDIITSDFTLTDKILRAALKGDVFPEPARESLDFIKSFARNFRVNGNVEGRAQEYILN